MFKLMVLISLTLTQLVFAKTQQGWGVNVTDVKKEVSKVKIGGRFQSILSHDNETESQDFYIRRLRVNLVYQPWKGHTFNYDVRNDNANKADGGEQQFVTGDAFWRIDYNKYSIKNFKFFRGKVDVSYSQTSSSKNLFNPTRAAVSEHASDYLVQNRRATNAQVNGNIQNLAYHLVISDGLQSGDLEDVAGNLGTVTINAQKLTYGGKLRYFFIGDAYKNTAQDTFYGQQDTISLGIGYFTNDKLEITDLSNSFLTNYSYTRSLTNVEFSLAYQGFRFLSEYFVFHNDLMNAAGTTESDVLGDSNGYYAQTEYVFNKWAPYVIYESFDKNPDLRDGVQNITTVGLNYYRMMEAQRGGIAYKKTSNGESIGNNEAESLYAYAMLNF